MFRVLCFILLVPAPAVSVIVLVLVLQPPGIEERTAIMSAARVDRSMMDEEDAVKTLTSIQTARKHAVCGQHGAATALLMQVCLRACAI